MVNGACAAYSTWFINDFAPKKVKEVASYSTWNIRSYMRLMKTLKAIKESSYAYDLTEDGDSLTDYLTLLDQDPSLVDMLQFGKGLYPHRSHDLIKPLQFQYIPVTYTLKRIAKLFIDYFKPYKSTTQVTQDFKQPLE